MSEDSPPVRRRLVFVASVYSAEELGQLASELGAIEDWLRESSTARHSEGMADVVGKAAQVIEDLYDEQNERENTPAPGA